MAMNKERASNFPDKAWKVVTTVIVAGTVLFTAREHMQRVQADNGLDQRLQKQGEHMSTYDNVRCWSVGEILKLKLYLLGDIVPEGSPPKITCNDIIYPQIDKIYEDTVSPTPAPAPSVVPGTQGY